MQKKLSDPISEGKLGEVIIVETRRPDGSLRIQQDFSNCPSMAEQHTGMLTDINYLMKKYAPDELASYLAARNMHRQEIIGHDFANEPSLQESKNIIYASKQEFEKLPEQFKGQFKSHLEFLKFIDIPANQEKMIRLGLLTAKKIEAIKIPENTLINKGSAAPEPLPVSLKPTAPPV